MASTEPIAGLLRKYEEVLRLRRAAEVGPEEDPRAAMAALAAEFPGALRETDELPIVEVERRVAELAMAITDPGVAAPWMMRMARFHALTRGALSAKRWLAGRKEIDDAVRRAFVEAAEGLRYPGDAKAWQDHLAALADPPRGRVTELVFERMAAELGVDVTQLRRIVRLAVD